MLTANLQTDTGLVNGSMGIVQDIIFKEDQGPPSLPIAVLISFDNYKGPTITSLETFKIKRQNAEIQYSIAGITTWNSKSGTPCLHLQIPVRLAWAITVHKSQGLTLRKATIDLSDKEFTTDLSFVAVSQVYFPA
ncbi:unnamed protein product [Rhizophagus irregularis]|nr:unnamed protein product [Rhizophagus irregularis]